MSLSLTAISSRKVRNNLTIYTAETPLVVTVTELLTYKRCRLQWSFVYRDKLAPRSEAPYFYTGRVVHKTLELWQDPAQDIEVVFAGVVAEQLEDVKQRYRDNFGCEMSPVEVDEIMERSHMSYCMVRNYVKRWGTPLPKGFRMIQPEQTFLVAIPGVDNVLLEGTLDALAEEIATGKLFVVEHKTYSARPQLHHLENAEQFVAYGWIISQAFPEREIGGVLYDGLWKREEPPKGRKFEDLFCRERILKKPGELMAFERNLTAVAREIANDPAIYPTRIWQGCYDDKDFDRLCEAMHRAPEDVDYIREEYYVTRPARWFDEEEDEE